MTQWFAPEVEWEPGGPAAVERALYRGRDEVASAFAATWETWEVFHVEESEVRDLGDSVVWLGSARMRGDASHVDFNQPFAVHFLVRAGKASASGASSLGKKPSKPPGCRSRPVARSGAAPLAVPLRTCCPGRRAVGPACWASSTGPSRHGGPLGTPRGGLLGAFSVLRAPPLPSLIAPSTKYWGHDDSSGSTTLTLLLPLRFSPTLAT